MTISDLDPNVTRPMPAPRPPFAGLGDFIATAFPGYAEHQRLTQALEESARAERRELKRRERHRARRLAWYEELTKAAWMVFAWLACTVLASFAVVSLGQVVGWWDIFSA